MTNGALKVDLRKSSPLGLDFDLAWDRAKDVIESYKAMGPGDTKKPGWYEHKLAREKHGQIITSFVALARLIAQAVGDERAQQIPGLKFAVEFRGLNFI